MNDSSGFLPGVLCASIVWLIIGWHSVHEDNNSWRDQIVAHKAAEYYLDQKNERQWRWIDPIKP